MFDTLILFVAKRIPEEKIGLKKNFDQKDGVYQKFTRKLASATDRFLGMLEVSRYLQNT
jgi:hypothetical protein